MPTDSCEYFYEFTGCKTRLKRETRFDRRGQAWNSWRGETRGFGMSAPFKYAFVLVLALALAFGFCIHAQPNLEEITKLAWLDEIDVIINKAIARLKPQAAVFTVDPVSAARVTEDLDYRIAERIGSVEGWRSFLAVHGSGVHAQTATGEVDRLLVSEQASAQATAKVSNETSLGAKAASDPVRPSPLSSGTEVAALTPESGVGSLGHETPVTAAEVSYGASSDAKAESEAPQPAPPSSGMQIATPTPDENGKRDGYRLTQPRSSPTSDVARASKPTSGTHRTASLLKGRPKAHASACAFRAACLWRGRERLFAVNRGRKLFTLFPLKVFSGANIASR
jgi:hypothetical protein